MSASNKPRPPDAASLQLLGPELRAAVLGLFAGALGRTVRCTPKRRMVRLSGRPTLFGKWRDGACADAAREWHWLHVLPLLGLRVPRPVAWVGLPRRSLLVTEAVDGRPMDAWMVEALAEGWGAELLSHAARRIAPAVRLLHAGGLFYRDLYWNHVFVGDPRDGDPPTFVDVERVFRPRWRRRRWVVKDLAGLLASSPVPVPVRYQLRFLRSYLGGEPLDPALMAAVVRKADRIRRHVPRFG